MMFDLFSGTAFILIYLIVAVFFILWPFLVWSHLREHTRYLREIRDLLQKKA